MRFWVKLILIMSLSFWQTSQAQLQIRNNDSVVGLTPITITNVPYALAVIRTNNDNLNAYLIEGNTVSTTPAELGNNTVELNDISFLLTDQQHGLNADGALAFISANGALQAIYNLDLSIVSDLAANELTFNQTNTALIQSPMTFKVDGQNNVLLAYDNVIQLYPLIIHDDWDLQLQANNMEQLDGFTGNITTVQPVGNNLLFVVTDTPEAYFINASTENILKTYNLDTVAPTQLVFRYADYQPYIQVGDANCITDPTDQGCYLVDKSHLPFGLLNFYQK